MLRKAPKHYHKKCNKNCINRLIYIDYISLPNTVAFGYFLWVKIMKMEKIMTTEMLFLETITTS